MWYPTEEMQITPTPKWKLVLLHRFAQMLGVLIKFEGWPLGSNRNMDFSGHTGNMQGMMLGGEAHDQPQTDR